MIHNFILDIDGTLVNSNDAHAHAWVNAFEACGYDTSFSQVRPLIGMGADMLMPTLFPDLSDKSQDGKRITDMRSAIFLHVYAPTLEPTKGAAHMVRVMKENKFLLAVATSAKEGEIKILLEKAGVPELRGNVTASDDVKRSKPHPDLVKKTLESNKWIEHESIMIGDTPYDIEAAHQAGIRVVALRCGGFSDEMLREADSIYDDPLEFSRHIYKRTMTPSEADLLR